MTLLERLKLLSQAQLFEALGAKDLFLLAEMLDEIELKKGETLFTMGDPGRELYLVASGTVELSLPSGQILAAVGKGQYFGEMALFDDSPRSAKAMALEETRLLSLTRSQLRRVILERPRVSFTLLQGLSKRLRETNARLR